MRKLVTAIAVGALAVGLTVAPGAIGKKSVKQVSGTVTVNVTPSTIAPGASTVTVSGNVKSSSRCRKNRDVSFAYASGATTTPVGPTVETRSNGDYTATVFVPVPSADTTARIQATVDQTLRKKKIKGKKKGANKGKKKGKTRKRKFNCLEITGQSSVITVNGLP